MNRFSHHAARILAYAAIILFCLLPIHARAGELWTSADGGNSVFLNPTLKLTGLATRTHYDPTAGQRWQSTGLARLRLNLSGRVGDGWDWELAYEQYGQAIYNEQAGNAGAAFLPDTGRSFYRIKPLNWQIAEDNDGVWRHEIDRALVAYHADWGEVRAGRQAIGLGRGAVFSAVDLFAPFAPTEVDREWRRGVDAIRVEKYLTPTQSVEALAVFGESIDESAFMGRWRGYVRNVDASLLAGRRSRDWLVAGVASAAVRDAEVHAEAALFKLDTPWPDGALFGDDDLVVKLLIGSSYTFDWGNGVTVMGEYHYSGFGVRDTDELSAALADEQFQKRLLRGDTQILGQHGVAGRVSYQFGMDWTTDLLVLINPVDGSGLVSPTAVYTLSDHINLTASLFIPWGASPENGNLQSEYGATPATLYLQLSMYY